jgi:hypothetical protein
LLDSSFGRRRKEVILLDSSYFDFKEEGREKTAYFVLDSLLKSRIECGFESNSGRYDEDVNVYLVHLLSSLVGAPSLGKHAVERDIDVFEQVRGSSDARFKSHVYRTNADYLLLLTGIFTGTPYVERRGQRRFDDATRGRIGRGKAYYHYASALHARLPASSAVFARVLQYLSEDFERYVDVLFHMRGEYFNLYEHLREDRLMSLREDVFAAPSASELTDLETLRNEFLDAYWLWHQNPDPASRNALIESAKRLRGADSSFEFQLPEH